MKIRSEKTKKAFIKYLQDPKNKDLRFWQAVRNFSTYDFIYGGKGASGGELEDTFFKEEL